MAVANRSLNVDSRSTPIQAAFTFLVWADVDFPRNIPERAASVVTPLTGNRLNRTMNLCVGLYYAIKHFGTNLALGRIGSHALECQIGTVRAVLRQDDRLDHWVSAEAAAILTQDFLQDLNVPPLRRRSRATVSGVVLEENDEELISFNMAEFDAAVRAWWGGDRAPFERFFAQIVEVLPDIDAAPPRTGSAIGGSSCRSRLFRG
jgi:hypothetical protein